MNIGIDARSLVEQKTGFGYFLENTLRELLRLDRANNYILFSDREIHLDFSYPNLFEVRYKDGLFIKKTFYYRWCLAKWIKKSGMHLDVFWGVQHFLPKKLDEETKAVLTIHDFTPMKYPATTTKFNRVVTSILFSPSLRDANEIVCISESTRSELEELYPCETSGKSIRVIYESGNPPAADAPTKIDISQQVREVLGQQFVLFTGTIEPRKNIRTLIEAAPLLKSEALVVVCGKLGWESSEIKDQLQNTENLVYLGYVSQEEKRVLMKHALCQIQPSQYEGFGIPVVECLQGGGIAVVADNSSLKEIIQMPELRFETGNAQDMSSVIKSLVHNHNLRRRAKEYCNNRASFFDWAKTARQYLSVFSAKE